MRAFTAIAGMLFGLLFLAHVWRIIDEGTGPVADPIFILTSTASLIASVWAFVLLIRTNRKSV